MDKIKFIIFCLVTIWILNQKYHSQILIDRVLEIGHVDSHGSAEAACQCCVSLLKVAENLRVCCWLQSLGHCAWEGLAGDERVHGSGRVDLI